MNWLNLTGHQLFRWGLALIIAAIGLLALLAALRPGDDVRADRGGDAALAAPGSDLLFRFDPATQTFYTFTLPASSAPYGVVVTGANPAQVWVAEFGRDRIGRLVYTDAHSFQWSEYPLAANSGPFRLALDGNYVWFTERGANRIGRLDTVSGQIVEFAGHGLSPNAGLACIQVAPDGSVWTVGQWSNRIIRLVVTSTVDYAFHEYTHALLSGPFGLAIEPGMAPSSYNVWFTAPNAHKVGRLVSSSGELVLYSPAVTSLPYEITITPNFGWFADMGRNGVGRMEIGTNPIFHFHAGIARPAGIAKESTSTFWMTQQTAQGAVARFVYTSATSTRSDSYPLPVTGLRPTGIAVAADRGVWLGALGLRLIHLPIVMKNY